MNKVVKVELSLKSLAIIAEALGEANINACACDNKRREEIIYAALEFEREGASAISSIVEDKEKWSGAFKWLVKAEEKGKERAWAMRSNKEVA